MGGGAQCFLGVSSVSGCVVVHSGSSRALLAGLGELCLLSCGAELPEIYIPEASTGLCGAADVPFFGSMEGVLLLSLGAMIYFGAVNTTGSAHCPNPLSP